MEKVDKNKDLNKKSLTAAIMYVINNFFIKAIGFITIPIFSRQLSTEEYGIVSNFQSWASVLMIIFSLDLYSSIQRAKIDYEEKLDEYLSSILTLSSIVIIIIFIFTNIFRDSLINLFDLNINMINILYIYIFFNCALEFYQMKHRVTLKYKQFTIITLITSVTSVILSLILINIMQDHATARIIGIILPNLVVSIFIFGIILLKGKKFINLYYWKYALKLSLPLIPHHLAGNILAQSDKIIITKLIGYEETAFYSMGYNIPSIATIVWSSLNNAWTPWFFEKMKVKAYQEIRKIFKYYILVFLVCIMGVMLVTPEIIHIIAPIEYAQCIYVVPPLLLGVMFQMIYSLYVNIEFYYKKNYFIPIGTILSAIINIVLNLILIPKLGCMVAAYTTLIGYFSLTIFHYIIAGKTVENKKIINEIFDLKYIIEIIVVITMYTIVNLCLYKLTIIRYIVCILIFAIIMILKRKKIIDIIELIRRKINDKKNDSTN